MGTHPIFESDFDCLTEHEVAHTIVHVSGDCRLGEDGENDGLDAPCRTRTDYQAGKS